MNAVAPTPLHEHRKGCTHRGYRLTCAAFDSLLRRAGGRCEICRRSEEEAQRGRPLYIDHDSRLGDGWNHVRGLLCCKCNTQLRYVDNGARKPSPAEQRYLDNAWFWTALPPDELDTPWLPETCADTNGAVYRPWSLRVLPARYRWLQDVAAR